MTTHAPPGAMVELRVRITPEHLTLFNRLMATDENLRSKSMALVAGELLAAGLLQQQADFIKRAAERQKALGGEAERRSVVEMFLNGVPITSIAALTKLPYRTITKEIGARADQEVSLLRRKA